MCCCNNGCTPELPVKIINKSGYPLPQYETVCSAGVDLRYCGTEEKTLQPMERALFGTGLYMEIVLGYEGQVRPRSGLAIKHGITVLNAPGTVDADYRGEVGVILINLSNEPYTVKPGDRIAQMVFAKYERVRLYEVEELSDTERGQGGFGHTGISTVSNKPIQK